MLVAKALTLPSAVAAVASPARRAWYHARSCRVASFARRNAATVCTAAASGEAHTGTTKLFAPSLRATERIAELMAADARAGDVICLHGDVGMGKSVFSRAFVRAVARDPHLEVPSPTYLLQQVYDEHDPSLGPPVHHFDLYRLAGAADMAKLGLDGSFTTAVSLLEWAERLGDLTPSVRLDVYISVAGGVRGSQSGGGGSQSGGRRSTGDGGAADGKTNKKEATTAAAAEGPGDPAAADAAEMAAEAAGATLVTCEGKPDDYDDEGDDEDDGVDDDEDDGVDPMFLDVQPRLIRLEPHGGEWRRRIDALMSSL